MTKKNYAGIPDEYSSIENSRIALIPMSYDGTSTWQRGADIGPQAFLEASENMELYDIETDSEVYKEGVFLADELKGYESPEDMVEEVYKETYHFLSKNLAKNVKNSKFQICLTDQDFLIRLSDLAVTWPFFKIF